MVFQSALLPPGLSPRVRGSQVNHQTGTSYTRSIPACAGEPTWPSSQMIESGVYPRVCGGAPIRTLKYKIAKGLSPRVRGSLLLL